MAKEARPIIHLACSVCQRVNYHTEKNVYKTKEPLKLQKYCRWCKKRTEHLEKKQ